MSESKLLNNALSGLHDLAPVEEIKSSVAAGGARKKPPGCNAHIHLPPNFSAFESVEQAIALADEQNVRVLGLSNYYDYRVYGDFYNRARAVNIFPLFGLEIIAFDHDLANQGVKVNDPGNPGRFYICGKAITRFAEMTPRALELIGFIRSSDRERMVQMTERIGRVFQQRGLDVQLRADNVIDMIVRRHGCARDSVTLQERHVSQAYQEKIFERYEGRERLQKLSAALEVGHSVAPADGVAIQGEIRSRLMKAGRPAFVEERFVTFDEGYDLVLELGGIPSYPTLADGADPICEFENSVDKLIERIKERNFHAAEFITVRNEPEILTKYVRAMRAAELIITAGTEHNTLDLIPMTPLCEGGMPIPDEVRDIFWEGACVAATHQFLTLHGECGYVDEAGRLNPNYDDDEQRISHFAAMGEAVIQRYFEQAE